MLDKRKDYSELRPFFSGLSRESTKKGVFGSLSYKVPFDYQMVTFEEIIKNDFFRWVQSYKDIISI